MPDYTFWGYDKDGEGEYLESSRHKNLAEAKEFAIRMFTGQAVNIAEIVHWYDDPKSASCNGPSCCKPITQTERDRYEGFCGDCYGKGVMYD